MKNDNVRYSISNVIRMLNIVADPVGNAAYDTFTQFRPLQNANAESLVFCVESTLRAYDMIAATNANIILANCKLPAATIDKLRRLPKSIWLCNNPKLQFSRIISFCINDSPDSSQERNIHATAIVHPQAVIGQGSVIGAYTMIGKAVIGENCVIENYVEIRDSVRIGNNSRIGSHCILGSVGFGYAKDESGHYLHVPQIGGVIIGNNVDIYPFCDIDRGTMDDTVIRDGVKINHHVHIAHNCIIGEHTIIRSGVQICGSINMLDHVAVGAGSIIRDNLTIGSYAIIGLGSVVVRDVEPHTTVFGNPAKQIVRI